MKRFWDKVNIDNVHLCWEWKASKSKAGYGRFRFKGKAQGAHRVSWYLTKGEIPEADSYHGTCVLHKCDNRGCVNPFHLFLGTHKQNIDDMIKKGRCRAGKYLTKKSHCPQGHPYLGNNLYIRPDTGGRQCKRCVNIKNLKRYHTKKER